MDVAIYKERWVNETIIKLGLTEEYRTKLSDMFDQNFSPKRVDLVNSYKVKSRSIDALSLLGEVEEHKLILNETGTMFKNQDDIMSPVTKTELKLYKGRDEHKKKYKVYSSVEHNNPILAGRFNLLQKAFKTLMNIYYGLRV